MDSPFFYRHNFLAVSISRQFVPVFAVRVSPCGGAARQISSRFKKAVLGNFTAVVCIYFQVGCDRIKT